MTQIKAHSIAPCLHGPMLRSALRGICAALVRRAIRRLGPRPRPLIDPLPRQPAAYAVTTPLRRADTGSSVFDGGTGRTVALLDNAEQAATLCDLLNLANGQKPSRRLLDAIDKPVEARLEVHSFRQRS